ncbi:MAG: undecaprenyldiphospho-muramoylpentapeptide beta-N-acetylglucosaminyltransferase [Deltaproteobacteria bacterium]|nr:MAG: undecaprenyldiphospho-muramoylpentapeptide beta-N-acetylglucosaminyltransferase [Deltaproteobacteria bacterium]
MPYAPPVLDPAACSNETEPEVGLARVLVAGGGTGGHLFPALAVAEELSRGGTELRFVGTARGIEARAVPEAGYPLDLLTVRGIKGRGLSGLATGISRLPVAFFESLSILRRFRPDVVLGVGGYASGPVVATAVLLRLPTVVMEQNSVPGITNRILGRFVDRVCVTYPPGRYFPASKVVRTGNPIRSSIVQRIRTAVEESVSRRSVGPTLLVLGGSQGARPINDAMMRAAPELLRRVPGLRIVHQTGRRDEDRVRRGYGDLATAGGRIEIVPFIEDMASAYASADLVLSRAGATTLAELAVAGRPAILVPFPHATDDHQTKNAEAFVAAGGAVLVPQHQLSGQAWLGEIERIAVDPDRRRGMARAMRSLARPDAAREVVRVLGEVARRGRPS